MGTRVDRWISDDGQEFKDERSMLIHELSLSDEKIIDLFLAQSDYPDKTKPQYKKAIQKYLAFVRDNDLVVDTPIKKGEENIESISPFPFPQQPVFDDDLDEFVSKSGSSMGFLSDD